MSAGCWHCNDSGRCVCLFCPGDCAWCEARQLQKEFEVFLEKFERHHNVVVDPRDPRYWWLEGNSPARRLFIPFELFLTWKKRREAMEAA